MIRGVLLAALAQAPQAATVGDTVWVGMTIAVPSRMIIRPQTWDLGDAGQVLGPAEISFSGDSARIRYPVTLWYPGEHTLRVPGPIVVSPEGQSDTLAAVPIRLALATVLPRDSSRASLEPRPAAQPIEQAARSLLPLTVFLLLAGGLLGTAYLVWLRRALARREAAPAPEPIVIDTEAVLGRWTRAGELRAAVDGWAHVIESRAQRAGAPVSPRTASWLAAAADAGFRDHAAPAALRRLLDAVPAVQADQDEGTTR